jgi:uncharacterized protein (TIGR02099 family)
MIHHIKRATRHLIFWSLIVFAVSLSCVRLLLMEIEHYKADLSARVSEFAGAQVSIGHLQANMRGYSPELVLKDIEILSLVANQPPPIQLKEIRIGINLLDALFNSDRLASSWVTLVGAKLTVKRNQDGSIAIVGLKASDEKPLWLLEGSKYEVLQSEIRWLDELRKTKIDVVGAVDFAIINRGDRHKLNMLVKLPQQYGDNLTVSMDLKGNIFEPSSLDGTGYLEGKNIKLAEWLKGQLPFAINIGSGIGDFKFWSELKHSQLASFVIDTQAQQLMLTKPGQETFFVKQLKSQAHWEHKDSQWHLHVPHFLLETADHKWPATVFNVFGDQAKDSKLNSLGIFVDFLDLEKATALLKFFAPMSKDDVELLVKSQLKGSLEQCSLFVDLNEKHFAVNGKFDQISIAPSSAMPGIENLTGKVQGTDQNGQVVLATKDASLTPSGIFREEINITNLNGAIDWQQNSDDWVISSPIIQIDSPDIKTKSRLNLSVPKTMGHKTFLDLQTEFSIDDVSKATRYLPVSTMKKSVVDWLDTALINGRVPMGNILFYGNLSDFPFTGRQGVFEVPFDIEQLELDYHPDWPRLNELSGNVLFLDEGLHVNLTKGFSNKVKINQAMLTIPVLGASEYLLVQGKLETEILQGLEFMLKTPLNSSAEKLLGVLEPKGNTQITLDLKLPLADGATEKVHGSAELVNVKLRVKPLDLDVSQISGALKFNEKGLYSDIIKASALNNPIKINIKSSDLQTDVNVSGRVGVNDLREQFKIPGWNLAKGATDYQLKLQLPYDDSFSELLVQSKLSGLSLDLPGALAKTREQQKSLALSFNLVGDGSLPIKVNYDNQLKVAINYNIKQLQVDSGNVLLGKGDVEQSEKPGINLEINRERLALQDWVSLALKVSSAKDNETNVALNSLNEIKIHGDHGLWKKADLGLIDLTLKFDGHYWAGDISSSIAKGKFKIPTDLRGADSVVLTMDMLDLTVIKQLKSQSEIGANLAPDFMPLMSVTNQKTLWQSVDLGQLSVETERIPNGISFKRVELIGVDQKLAFSGDWKINGDQSETHIQGNLGMPRAGQFFSKLGISKDLTETIAVVDFTGDWKAAPYQFSLADLQSQIVVNFTNGRILGIEPGFGRVLGILAMAQWIKRFQLDFSDVFDDGLTFANITGTFNLLNGKAVTNNLVVDAIPAKISITGTNDLINKTVDYNVSVVPKSADAVPVAGTIMGKLADFIGRTLTGKDQEGFFFGSQYLVKGGWGNVQIIPVHENDGLLQKTWDGITGFPWLKQSTEQ